MKQMRRAVVLGCIAVLISVAGAAYGETVKLNDALASRATVSAGQADWVVVIDLTTAQTNSLQAGNTVFSFPGDTRFEAAGEVKSIEALLALIRESAGESTNRWVSSPGESVNVYVIHPDTTEARVVIDEKKRDTQLATDLQTLVKLAKSLRGAAVPAVTVTPYRYTLTKVRSNCTITAQSLDQGKPVSAAQTVLVTGPSEHWFLSADVAVNKVNELKYNKDTNAVEIKEKPAKFLIGVNYMLGDALTEKWGWTDAWQGITFKFQFEASKRPMDSVGLGIGYRFPPIANLGGFSLEAFSPFATYTRVGDDDVKTRGWIAGISVNLDKALGWVGK